MSSELLTKYPNQAIWILEQMPGPILCKDAKPQSKKVILKNCPDNQYCYSRGHNILTEFCLFGTNQASQIKQFNKTDLNQTSPPKNNHIRIRRPQKLRRPVDILGVELVSANPQLMVQMLEQLGGAKCGSGYTPIKLDTCPQDRFCRAPGGHELCIYGPNEFNQMTQIKWSDLG